GRVRRLPRRNGAPRLLARPANLSALRRTRKEDSSARRAGLDPARRADERVVNRDVSRLVDKPSRERRKEEEHHGCPEDLQTERLSRESSVRPPVVVRRDARGQALADARRRL